MEKIWLKNYPPEVPSTIDPDQYASIPEMLEEAFKKYSDTPCFMNFGESLTFKQIDELSEAYAGFLQTECGLVKGDRVAIMMPNCLQYPIALFGALRAGMVNVNISPLYTTQQVHMALQDTGAKCVLVLANFAHLVQKALPNTDVQHVIVTEIGDLFRLPKRLIFNFVIKYIKKMVPPWYIKNFIPFRSTIKLSYQKQFKKPNLCADDIAYLQFTEGREMGSPKCAILTHRNFIANGLQCSAWFEPGKQYSKGITLAPLPFFKLITLSCHCLTFMRNGTTTNLITNPRDVSLLVKEIKAHPLSIMSGLRTIFNDLLFNEDFLKINFSSLRLVFSGGMAIPQSVADRWQSLTQTIILQGYVLTEGAPMVIVTPLSAKKFTGSVGLPLPSTDVKICDDNGQELPLGTPGEIWFQGPQVTKGYWNQPEETKKALTEDGWFKSGDIGYMNEEGFVYLVDRKEDLIKKEQDIVYPSEVESVITEINGVEEAVVVSAQTESQQFIVKAYVVKTDLALSEDTIFSHCRRHLAGYQVPDEIEFCDELPRSATGYILRRQLKS